MLKTSAFSLVRVMKTNPESDLEGGMRVLVPAHMVEEACFFGKTYYLITENSVIGFYAEEKK